MQQSYLKVTPSRELLDSTGVVEYLDSLREIQETSRLPNVVSRGTKPVLEVLIFSEGKDEAVEFYIGVEPAEELPAVKDTLSSLYPDSFELSEVDFSLVAALNEQAETHTALESANPDREEAQLPVAKDNQPDENLYQGETTPYVVQWIGDEKRRLDWMTPIKRFTTQVDETDDDNPGRSPLSNLLEVLTESPYPAAFQVLFTPKDDWSEKAKRRKTRIRMDSDGLAQSFRTAIEEVVSGSRGDDHDEEKRNRHRGRNPSDVGGAVQGEQQAGGDIGHRSELIDKKRPGHTFEVNLRTVILPLGQHRDEYDSPSSFVSRVQNSLNHLDGEYYGLKAVELGRGIKDRLADSTSYLDADGEKALQKMANREIETSGRLKGAKESLVLNPDELANFAVVPSAQRLTKTGQRGTRGKPQTQDPLPAPDPDALEKYSQDGMAVGYPIGQDRDTHDHPVQLSKDQLTKHVARLASTGGGKSVAVINDALTAHANIPGPTVIVEPLGDNLTTEYMRAHLKQFNTLDDVYYFPVPDSLPAFSFFDIRPALARGVDREKAVEDIIERFKEILEMLMGPKEFRGAPTSIRIIENLIRAKFDPDYGEDAFGISELYDAAYLMRTEDRLPEMGEQNRDVEKSLARHFDSDTNTFSNVMDGAINRLEEITSNGFLKKVFNHVPEWDPHTAEYAEPTFDFRRFLDEDVVLLFDTGKLRPEARRALTLLFLSNFWQSAKLRRRTLSGDPEHITNLILEEAAPIAATELVARELVPQGRGFGVSIEFVMQFSEQVALERGDSTGERGYHELLNNVHTKLIGNIDLDENLAKTLENERLSANEWEKRLRSLPSGEWIASLVSPGFQDRAPEPFSLAPLPIPPGHSQSDDPLHPDLESNFVDSLKPKTVARSRAELGIENPSDSDSETGFHGDSESLGFSTGSDSGNGVSATAAGSGESASGQANDRPSTTGTSTQAPSAETQSAGGATASTPSEGINSLDQDMGADSGSTPSNGQLTEADSTAAEEETTISQENPLNQDVRPVNDPPHIKADTEGNQYVCTVCKSTYQPAQRSSARGCCTFETTDEFLNAVPRLFLKDPSEQTSAAASARVHANNIGVDVDITSINEALEAAVGETDDSQSGGTGGDSDSESDISHETFHHVAVNASDDALKEHNLSRDEAKFLGIVIDAMNDKVEGYSLLDSMTQLKNEYDNIDIEKLEANGLIEQHRVNRVRYYTATPQARNLLESPLEAAPYSGDLGEKTPHKVGVELLRQWFETREDVAETEKYYPLDDGEEVLDAVGLTSEGELAYAGEVELSSNNSSAVAKDYEQLADVDADVVWAFKNSDEAGEVLDTLNDHTDLTLLLTTKDKQTTSNLRERVEKTDGAGIDTFRSFRELEEGIEE